LTLPDLSGSQQALAEYRGKRLLLVFSDPDCDPCQRLAPELARLHQQHCANDLEVVMISRGGAEANATKAKEHGIAFPILLQQHWEACKSYSVIALPTGFLIDKRGAVAKDVAIGPEEILQLV
jgi:peroxiredoxin